MNLGTILVLCVLALCVALGVALDYRAWFSAGGIGAAIAWAMWALRQLGMAQASDVTDGDA